MFSMESQQIEICLLKANLEEIENKIIAQHNLALVDLDAENIQKHQETLTVLRVAHYLYSTIEKLKQENVMLTAKRAQLKHKCKELSEALESAHMNRDKLSKALKDEDNEIELQISQYELSLQEKAERFRRHREYYDEAAVNKDRENKNKLVDELERELSEKQSFIDALKNEAEGIRPEVPDNIAEIFGKRELGEKIKTLTAEMEALCIYKI